MSGHRSRAWHIAQYLGLVEEPELSRRRTRRGWWRRFLLMAAAMVVGLVIASVLR